MAIVQAVIVKSFTYRGSTEEYSNVYHFDGTQPADSSAWSTVLTAIRDAEKSCLPSGVTWVDGYGYNAGSWETKPQTADAHVHWTTSNVGSLSTSGAQVMPGDDAVWVRWDTGDTNSKGKPIYLRKYFHPAVVSSASVDNVLAGQATALATYGGKMVDGTTIAGGLVLCRPNGHHGSNPVVGTYVTTRTLKRRGKRPGA
jgi:hypothetical protein